MKTETDSSIRPLVIYHGNCADGFGAAWCFWRRCEQPSAKADGF